jgi:predicted AAA+ superfamily ATPase
MVTMQRIYQSVLAEHFEHNRQMAWLAGPRQSGKTTTSLQFAPGGFYLNWDDLAARRDLAAGPDRIAERAGLRTAAPADTIIFDEIHKLGRWKTYLKGFFDVHGAACRVVVTGSARLNVYRRGGDSLMGRYFLFRHHPLSLGELLRPTFRESLFAPPMHCDDTAWEDFCRFGGFPEPLIKARSRFSTRWRNTRREQTVREDARDSSRVSELGQLELLATILAERSGSAANYATLSREVLVSEQTVRRWVDLFERLYYCFRVTPWFRNVSRSLRKTPRIYLWDWSGIIDVGARAETMIACHLLKAAHYWEDIGLGRFGLHYLRDKQQREVDFLVVRDGCPMVLVEVKAGESKQPTTHLTYFQNLLQAPHALQVCFAAPFVDRDCLSFTDPTVVPARTFLSQLI